MQQPHQQNIISQTTVQQAGNNNQQEKSTDYCYRIGHAYLYPIITKKQYLRLFNQKVIQFMKNKVWNFKDIKKKEKEILKWSKRLTLMKEAYLTQFHYAPTCNPLILQTITNIKFVHLKYLNLFCAGIQNYQALSFLDARVLQSLNLIYNNTANFKALAKMNMPSLRNLCIYIKRQGSLNVRNKPITFQIQNIQRWGFNLIELRFQKNVQDVVMLQDLSKLAKSKQTLKVLYICPRGRVQQKNILRKLKQKQQLKAIVFVAGQPIEYVIQP